MEILFKGHLKRTENHALYVERIGNPTKPSIIFNHGGPGLGFQEKDKDFFDFNSCNVIFYDQRVCGKSIATNALEENTTEELIDDINYLMAYFDLERVLLFGGSWGATLSLVFAIRYPEKVTGLVLRGVFLATKASRQYFEKGGTQALFPEVWNRLKRPFKNAKDEALMDLYFEAILKNDAVALSLAFEFVLYGASINSPQKTVQELERQIKPSNFFLKSLIVSHYSIHDFFLADDYIETHLAKLDETPITIIHGTKDYITRLDLVRKILKLQHIEWIETEEGHSPHTVRNKESLSRAVEKMLSKIPSS